MAHTTLADGTRIFYEERGSGRPVIFSHDWASGADVWAPELAMMSEAGYRAFAYDRRGHGRSDPSASVLDADQGAADLAALVEALQLEDIVLVGHGLGGGEVVRFAARQGKGRVSKIATVGSVTPTLLASDANPDGTPRAVFDRWRHALQADPSRFWAALASAHVGDESASDAREITSDILRRALRVDPRTAYDGITLFSETDFSADLTALDVPVFIAHGDEDVLVPSITSERAITKVARGTLKLYPRAPHGLFGSFRQAFLDDLLRFLSS